MPAPAIVQNLALGLTIFTMCLLTMVLVASRKPNILLDRRRLRYLALALGSISLIMIAASILLAI